MRYELRRYRCEISFDILSLGGYKYGFMRYELRRYRYEISFDILLLGGSKINFLLLGRSEECEI